MVVDALNVTVRKVKVSHLHSTFPQNFHHIKGTLQYNLTPWLRPLTVSFLYEEEPPPLRSTPWGTYRTRAAISWFPSQCSEPIWNAHIPPITIIHQVLILLTHRGMEG